MARCSMSILMLGLVFVSGARRLAVRSSKLGKSEHRLRHWNGFEMPVVPTQYVKSTMRASSSSSAKRREEIGRFEAASNSRGCCSAITGAEAFATDAEKKTDSEVRTPKSNMTVPRALAPCAMPMSSCRANVCRCRRGWRSGSIRIRTRMTTMAATLALLHPAPWIRTDPGEKEHDGWTLLRRAKTPSTYVTARRPGPSEESDMLKSSIPLQNIHSFDSPIPFNNPAALCCSHAHLHTCNGSSSSLLPPCHLDSSTQPLPTSLAACHTAATAAAAHTDNPPYLSPTHTSS